MFVTGFDDSVVMRFGKLELVRNQWRKFKSEIDTFGLFTNLPVPDPVTVNTWGEAVELLGLAEIKAGGCGVTKDQSLTLTHPVPVPSLSTIHTKNFRLEFPNDAKIFMLSVNVRSVVPEYETEVPVPFTRH